MNINGVTSGDEFAGTGLTCIDSSTKFYAGMNDIASEQRTVMFYESPLVNFEDKLHPLSS